MVSSKAVASQQKPVAKPAAKKAVAKKAGAKKTAAKKSIAKKAQDEAHTIVDFSAKKTLDVDLSFVGSKDEAAESRNIASRERVRSTMESEIEAFLNNGGKIDNIEPNVMGDPPRKPESNYGSRPI